MTALSLKFRLVVVGAVVVVLGIGVGQVRRAPVDVLPEFTPPQVQIQTEALGLSAAEVEQLITVPLEQDLLNGIPWLDQIRSESVPGRSSIELVFEPGTDVLHARQMVQEHLTQAHALPQVGTPPVMVQPTSSTSRVLMIGLGAKDISLIDLSVLARWKIKPRLMGLPGVANVAIWGQRDRQLQVQVDPARLRQYGVSLSQVVNTTGNALWVSPLTFVEASTPGTGGFIDTKAQRLAIQHVFPITTAKGLSAVSIEDTGGRRLQLGQVASVVEDHQPLIGDAVLGRGTGLMLVVEKFPNANTEQVTQAVERALDEMRPGLSGISIDTGVYRPATFIDRGLRDLGRWGLVGLVLLVLVLGASTRSWRVAVIATVAISLSLVAAAWVLYLRGTTFNVMILAGLAAAVGICVDDVVVDIDAIRRRLRAERESGGAATAADLVTDAAPVVRGALVYAALIVVVTPLPALALGGVGGAFARPFVLSYALAVAASTLVALIVTPVLSVLLAGGGRLERTDGPVARLLRRGYDRAAPALVRRPIYAYAAVGVVALAGLSIIPQLRAGATLPALRDRGVLVHWTAVPGTSLAEMSRITGLATRELRALPGVRDAGSHVGRAILGDETGDVNSAETWLTLAEPADYEKTLSAVKDVVRRYPGLRSDVQTYPAARIREIEGGQPGDVVVRVYGADPGVLQAKAEDVRRLLMGVRGISRPQVEQVAEQPTIQVQVDLAAAQRYGIKPGDVRRAAATYFAGLPVGSLYEESKIFDVVVWGTPSVRYTPATVIDLLIDVPGGGFVRLGDVASVRMAPAATVIRHENIFRSLDVTAAVDGRSAAAVADDVRARLRTFAMPLEYHAEVIDNATRQAVDERRVLALGLAVLAAVYLLLQAAFGSWRLATMVMLTLPVALVGGVLGAWTVGGVRALGALTGLLVVFGLAVRNAILLVRGYQQARPGPAAPGSEDSGPPAVLAVTRERVAPIALTALAVTAAVVPLFVLGRVPGTEAVYPMAATIVGGLVSSTLLALFLLPVLYLRFAPRPRAVPAEPETPRTPERTPGGP